jgi:hypothetical protein
MLATIKTSLRFIRDIKKPVGYALAFSIWGLHLKFRIRDFMLSRL